MTYLLDTNAVVALLRDRPPSVREHLRAARTAGIPVTTSAIVLYELWFGVARSTHREANTERLRLFLAGEIEVVPFEEADAAAAGDLRAALEAIGTPIGPYDLLIASQALNRRATLVTANVREFARVPGLTWVDWSVAGGGPAAAG